MRRLRGRQWGCLVRQRWHTPLWRRERSVVLVWERVGVWGSRTHTVAGGRPRGGLGSGEYMVRRRFLLAGPRASLVYICVSCFVTPYIIARVHCEENISIKLQNI